MGTLGQRVAVSDSAASSLGSMLSPHFVFTLTKWVMYSHRAGSNEGSQVEGSWSALLRLVFAVTAISAYGASRSLA
jgi:hypothetical protein